MVKTSHRQMRGFVRETAEAYLDPMVSPERVNVDKMAKHRKLRVGAEARTKIDRYALATAASHILMTSAIEGQGIQAQFKFQRQRYTHVNPIQDLGNVVREAIKTTGQILNGYDSRFSFLLDRYVELSEAAAQATVRFASFIIDGGSLPTEGSQFAGVSAASMEQSPLINQYDGDVRALAAHGLIHLATGPATDNVGIIRHVPTWIKEGQDGVQLIGRSRGYTLQRTDGSRLFSISTDLLKTANFEGPNLHCPAHQLLFDNLDTALELGFHATVNLAHDRGIYDTPAIGDIMQRYPSAYMPIISS